MMKSNIPLTIVFLSFLSDYYSKSKKLSFKNNGMNGYELKIYQTYTLAHNLRTQNYLLHTIHILFKIAQYRKCNYCYLYAKHFFF